MIAITILEMLFVTMLVAALAIAVWKDLHK